MFAELVKRALAVSEPEPADEFRQRILDAALAQFTDFGLRRSTMEDVARRAGLSRVTVYRRFSGKDELMEAVVLREVRRYFDGLTEVRSRAADAEERVVESAAFSMSHLRAHPLLRRLIDTEPEAIVLRLSSEGDSLLKTAHEFTSAMILDEVCGSRPVPPGIAERVGVLAEVCVRLILSFVLNDRGVIPMSTVDDAREFARHYVAPVYADLIARAAAAEEPA